MPNSNNPQGIYVPGMDLGINVNSLCRIVGNIDAKPVMIIIMTRWHCFHTIIICARTACRITDAVLDSIRNSLPAEALPAPPVVGWVEKDGNKGDTSPDEEVFKGEKVEAGVVININPCYSW